MIKEFNSLTFTVLRGCSMQEFCDSMWDWDFALELMKQNKAKCQRSVKVPVLSYVNPNIGKCLWKFSWWTSARYPNVVFFMSNMADGFLTVWYNIRKDLQCESISCRIWRNDEPYPLNEFYYTNSKGEERYVRSMKEDRWSFFEIGNPLPIEDLSLYKKRFHKDKMNMKIVLEYLNRMGISFEDIDEDVIECFTFERTEW